MLTTKNKNSNYLAKVFCVSNIQDVPNSDRLSYVVVDFQRVLTSKGVQEGSLYIYFPLESALNKDYLSFTNSFSKSEKNKDTTQKGFFDNNGRVRAIRLRGNFSEGYIVPVSSIINWYNTQYKASLTEDDFVDGILFDTIGKVLLCEKYVPKQTQAQSSISNHTKQKGRVKRHDLLVDNQFRFHVDTAQLKRNMHRLTPDDVITVSEKLHGCVDKDTLVDTLELGSLAIKKIVDNRLDVRVKAFDTIKKEIVYVKIDDYYYYPNDDNWYEIELEDGRKIEITGNNPIWMPELDCYRRVDELIVGDIVLVN